MGGVLQYTWEVYCWVSPSSRLPSQEGPAIQMGGVLPYKLEVYCRTFFETSTLRLLNTLDSEDRGLKVRFSLAMIVFETFELILCQMLSSQGKNAPSNPLSSLFSAFSNLKVGVGVSETLLRYGKCLWQEDKEPENIADVALVGTLLSLALFPCVAAYGLWRRSRLYMRGIGAIP